LINVSAGEKTWACTVARRGLSMVALLIQLKVLQHIGRFLPFPALQAAGSPMLLSNYPWKCLWGS
jgi:hypothetical protein